MNLSEWMWGGLGLVLTVMILSYLIGDNFLFRIAAHLFVGLTAGYLFVLIINQVIWPYLLVPLFTGSWADRLWLMIPLVLVLMLLVSQIPRFAGIGGIPLAFLAGLTAAVAIGGAIFGILIPQSWAVIDAFDTTRWYADPDQTWFHVLNAGVMLIGVVSTLSYFHFGGKRQPKNDREAAQRPLPLQVLSKVGEVFIGVTLGAIFAGVFSTALMALIDRIIFINQFITSVIGGG